MARFTFIAILCLSGGLMAHAATATLKSAKVTQIKNDVRLTEASSTGTGDSGLDPAPPRGTVRPAKVGDVVEGKKTLSTGRQSRAELQFNDDTIARLGANSVFSFKPGSRDLDLKSGFLLLHTPKGKGGAQISTPSASASVLGTTIMLASLPGGGMKLVVLEGTASVKYNGVTQLVSAGQLVFMTPDQGMSPPITISLQQLVGSSGLLNGFSSKIGSEQLIQEAIKDQADMIAEGELEVSGVNIAGDGTLGIVNAAVLQALLDQLERVSIALATLTAELDEDLTGSFTIAPPTTGDFAVPVLTDPTGAILQGTMNEAGVLTFLGDRFHFALGPPANVANAEGVTGFNFVATGASVNYETSFNAIRFDGFVGSLGSGGEADVRFAANRGSLGIFNSNIEQTGNILFQASGIGANAGNVEMQDTTLLSRAPGQINLASARGNVIVDQSQLYMQAGPGNQIQMDAPGPNATIHLSNSIIDTSLGALPGGVNIGANQTSGYVNIINTDIIAANAGGASPVRIAGSIIDLTAAYIKAGTVQMGNQAGTAAVNFHGTENIIYVNGGADGVTISGTQTGSYMVGDLANPQAGLEQVGTPAP